MDYLLPGVPEPGDTCRVTCFANKGWWCMINNNMMILLRDVAILFPSFLLVFTFRGFSRAIVAKWQGDDTAYRSGFVTLNPVAHVDIVGLSIVLFVLFLLGGLLGGSFSRPMLYILLIFMGVRWTYTVPFEPRNFRSLKRGAVLTILASSFGCFLLTFIFLYVQKYLPFNYLHLGAAKSIASIGQTVILLSSYFGVLALLPIPPFDGGRLLQFVLPYSKQWIVSWLEEYSLFILLALFLLPVVSDLFFAMINTVTFFVIQLLSLFVF